MNIDAIKQMVQNGPWALNRIVESNLYGSWSDSYVRINLKNAFDEFKAELLKEGFNLDELKKCDGVTLRDFGLKVWGSLDDNTDLWAFPVWMYEMVPDGYKVTDIFGDEEEFKHGKTDDDQRCGCLSFGFALPRERYEELKAHHEKLKAESKKGLDKTEEK